MAQKTRAELNTLYADNATREISEADLREGFESSFNLLDDTTDEITEGGTAKFVTAAEKTKLAGIEDSATADQTGAEIKALYEAEPDTNAFTDAEKTKLTGAVIDTDLISESAGVADAGKPIKLNASGVLDASFYTDTNTTDHTALSNIGTNTHEQIDNHIANTSNPHSVTKAQVGLTNVTDDAQLKRGAGDILSFTEKVTPASADILLIEDSADGNNKKRLQIGNLPTGGGGEANVGANVGTAGVGVYKTKSGVELQFKKINAGSTKVTITDDTGNDEIDIDISEANISHNNIADAGTNTHAQIDTHIANTTNPHSVTKTQVGLSNVDNTSDADKPVSTATQTALDDKLESSDIANFETTSQLNTRDNNNRNRSNHTGTQLSSTISDFSTAVSSNAAVTANTAKIGVTTELKPTDIDTLSELNAIITDATLIDTADPRLSDARTPTAHLHDLTTDVTNVLPVLNGGTGLTSLSTLLNSNVTPASLGLIIGTDVQAFSSILNNTTASFLVAQETKLGHISVTQAVNLDTMESDIATNNAKVTNATHTGDVTGSTVLTVAANVVTNAKLANVATSTIKGRITASTGVVEDLTATQVRTLINVADGATANSSDATLLARANHTGTQTASTISDFDSTVSSNATVTSNTTAAKFEALGFAVGDETTEIVAGTAKLTFRMPFAMTLSEVRANVKTAPTGSTLIFDINENGTSILSTKLSIDATEKTSTTAATAAVISDSSLADDAEIIIDIDQAGATYGGLAPKIWLIGTRV